MWRNNIKPTSQDYETNEWNCSKALRGGGLRTHISQSIPPNSSSSLPDKAIFQFVVYYYEPVSRPVTRKCFAPWLRACLSMLLIWQWICFYPGHQTRGVTRGGKGGTIPQAPNHYRGRRMTAEGAEKSQQYHKYCLQYSTYTSERPQVRTWVRQTCFLPWTPPNLVRPLSPAASRELR